jgi:hypothetical protein
MKKFSVIVLFLISFFGFSQINKEVSKIPNVSITERFPEKLNRMFSAHGTYEYWDTMNQLSFDLLKKGGATETHLVDLKSRKTLISSSKFTIGFDGNDVWMNAEGKFPIERARFYHNLYFYFYAMPFVLGDPGITYSKVKDLSFENKTYTGYKITYSSNVGDSPDDNYFVYFDKASQQMSWLGYTVTYGDDKPSTEIHYIKYTDWQKVNGLLLPKKLQWYDSENNLPVTPSNAADFENISVSEKMIEASKFVKPVDGLVGEK